jgi:hypothetical protein
MLESMVIAGARVLVIMETKGCAEVIRAEAEILDTGDAVGITPFSVTRGVGDGIEREEIVACTESPEITALATICNTGIDCVNCTPDVGDMTKGEVKPFSTIAIEDPEVTTEYVVPSTTIPDPPAEMV